MSRLARDPQAEARARQHRMGTEATAITRVFCQDIVPAQPEALAPAVRQRVHMVMKWLPRVEAELSDMRNGRPFAARVQREMVRHFSGIVIRCGVDLRHSARSLQVMTPDNWWTGINVAHLLTLRVRCICPLIGETHNWERMYHHLDWLSDYTERACPEAIERAWNLYDKELR